jgi:hypothetical protein
MFEAFRTLWAPTPSAIYVFEDGVVEVRPSRASQWPVVLFFVGLIGAVESAATPMGATSNFFRVAGGLGFAAIFGSLALTLQRKSLDERLDVIAAMGLGATSEATVAAVRPLTLYSSTDIESVHLEAPPHVGVALGRLQQWFGMRIWPRLVIRLNGGAQRVLRVPTAQQERAVAALSGVLGPRFQSALVAA